MQLFGHTRFKAIFGFCLGFGFGVCMLGFFVLFLFIFLFHKMSGHPRQLHPPPEHGIPGSHSRLGTGMRVLGDTEAEGCGLFTAY